MADRVYHHDAPGMVLAGHKMRPDAHGRLRSVTNRVGQGTEYRYDLAKNEVTVTAPATATDPR
jgi:YD repeat-containing protein